MDLVVAAVAVVENDGEGEEAEEGSNFGRKDVNDCRRSESGRRRGRNDYRDEKTAIGREQAADEREEPN